MKRIRLSTLMLLVVIAALVAAFVIEQGRAAGREGKLRARLDLHESAMELERLRRYEEAKLMRARIAEMGR